MSEKKPYYLTTAIAYTSVSHILAMSMRLFWLIASPDSVANRGMTFVFKQEQMNMVRRLNCALRTAGWSLRSS